MQDVDIYTEYAETKYEILLLSYKPNKTEKEWKRYKTLKENINGLEYLIIKEAMMNQGFEWNPMDIDGHPGSRWTKTK